MSKPFIVISRLWISRWHSGHSEALGSNIAIALAYEAQAAKLFDMGPSREGRKRLSDLLTPAILAEHLMPGYALDLQSPDSKMSMPQSLIPMDGVRVERCLFELKVSMPMAQSNLELEAASRRLAGVMGKALEPWLGTPLALRAQAAREPESMFAKGGDATCGDLGIIAAYRSSGSIQERPGEFAAWSFFLAELNALEQAKAISGASPTPRISETKLPRL